MEAAEVPPPGSLKRTVVRGAIWTGGANAIAIALSAVTGLALARILSPADFGIQAAIVTVTAFFTTITDIALGTAIVQRNDFRQAELSTLFWSGVGASIVVWVCLALGAPQFARLFSTPALIGALPVASLTVMIAGFAIVPTALLRQRLEFSRVARAQAFGALAGAAAAVAVALAGGHYWALVSYSLVSATLTMVVVVHGARWTPSPIFAPSQLASIRLYAGSMISFQSVNYWSRNLNSLLIGRFLGIDALGFFNFGQRLVGTPLQLLNGSLAPLLHPAFASMGADAARQRQAYLRVARVMALITFPLGAILFAVAEPLVMTLAGPAWVPSVTVVRAFALLVAVQPVNALCGPVFMARDAAHIMLRCAIIGAIAAVAAMLMMLPLGVGGVAFGYSMAYALVAAPVSSIVAARLIGAGPRDLAKALTRPAVAGVITLAVLTVARSIVLPAIHPAFSLAILIGLSILALAVIAGPTIRQLIDASRHGAAA